MKDINNRSLAMLLVVVIATSLAGTWLVLTKAPGVLLITGRQTDTGTASVTVNTVSSIDFTVDAVAFGTGNVNTSNGNTNCVLDTEGTNDAAKCTSFNTVTVPFEITNTGNANLSVNLNFSNNAATFIGGTSPVYNYKVSENESNSCAGGVTDATSYESVNNSDPEICANLEYLDAKDSLNVDINITIPYDTATGAKSSTLTVTGTAI